MVRLPRNKKQIYRFNFSPQMWLSIWPGPWPWPWIFKGKYGISYISTKSGPNSTKRKANLSINVHAWNVTKGFELDHNFDLWIFKVKCDLDLWSHTWLWPWIAVTQNGRADWHWTKGMGVQCMSFMTIAVTIWWPRSDVRIYQIVTGVTSDVGEVIPSNI